MGYTRNSAQAYTASFFHTIYKIPEVYKNRFVDPCQIFSNIFHIYKSSPVTNLHFFYWQFSLIYIPYGGELKIKNHDALSLLGVA